MKYWEYQHTGSMSIDNMDNMGNLGWELVSVTEHGTTMHNTGIKMYWKREKKPTIINGERLFTERYPAYVDQPAPEPAKAIGKAIDGCNCDTCNELRDHQ